MFAFDGRRIPFLPQSDFAFYRAGDCAIYWYHPPDTMIRANLMRYDLRDTGATLGCIGLTPIALAIDAVAFPYHIARAVARYVAWTP